MKLTSIEQIKSASAVGSTFAQLASIAAQRAIKMQAQKGLDTYVQHGGRLYAQKPDSSLQLIK